MAGGGADRVELCRRLDVGGLTPALTEVVAARAALSIPLHVLVRPREGPFVYSGVEVEQMAAEISAVRAAGADGVVVGALTPGGELDVSAMRRLLDTARPLSVTFHRAFDGVTNQPEALEALVALGVDRVLTSGGAATALEGAGQLCRIVDAAAGRIVVMAGGGIRPDNVAEVVRRTGVTEVHARMDDDPERARRLRVVLNESREPRAESRTSG